MKKSFKRILRGFGEVSTRVGNASFWAAAITLVAKAVSKCNPITGAVITTATTVGSTVGAIITDGKIKRAWHKGDSAELRATARELLAKADKLDADAAAAGEATEEVTESSAAPSEPQQPQPKPQHAKQAPQAKKN